MRMIPLHEQYGNIIITRFCNYVKFAMFQNYGRIDEGV